MNLNIETLFPIYKSNLLCCVRELIVCVLSALQSVSLRKKMTVWRENAYERLEKSPDQTRRILQFEAKINASFI